LKRLKLKGESESLKAGAKPWIKRPFYSFEFHNSARSQMAEGLVNTLYADRLEVVSGAWIEEAFNLKLP